MGQSAGGHLPAGLLELARNDEAVCLTFVHGATVDPPTALTDVFSCIRPGQGPLDALHPTSHPVAVALFEQARRHGRAMADIRLLLDPGRQYRLHVFDLEDTHGCFAGIVVPLGDGSHAPSPAALVPPPPRHMELRLDVAGMVIAIDDATTDALGWSAAAMQATSALDHIHPDDHERSIAFWVELLGVPGATRRVRQRWHRRNGGWVWMEATQSNLLNDPGLQCVLVELVDISDEMEAQTALAEREELLARLTEALPIGVVQIDANDTIVFSNPRWFEIAGLGPDGTYADFLALTGERDREALTDALTKARGAGSDGKVEVAVITPGGAERTCRLRFAPLTPTAAGARSVVVSAEDITQSHELQRRLQHQAERDPLTGLLNRNAIMDRLERVIVEARRIDSTAAVLFVDLDGFKAVNDRHGHAAGDELLKDVARRIRTAVRAHDIVGRLGGDEFVIVAPGISEPKFAHMLSDRLEIEIAAVQVKPGERLVTGSVGVAVLTDETVDAAEMLALADRRMYEVKRARSMAGPRPDPHPLSAK